MNERPHHILLRNEPAEGKIDGLLRRYFQRQLPQPWPVPPRVSSRRPEPVLPFEERRRPRLQQRFALAAAIGLFLLGYLALSHAYPNLSGPVFNPTQRAVDGHIGGLPAGPKAPADPGLPGSPRSGIEKTSGKQFRWTEHGRLRKEGDRVRLQVEQVRPASQP